MTKPTMTQARQDLEHRHIGAEVRLVARAEGQLPTIVGYAAVFDSLSEDLGGFRERIRPGAFDAALASGRIPLDVRALVDHLPYRILGRTTVGTCRLSVDARGLKVEIDPPDNTIGRDTIESIRRGDITGMSFGFVYVTDSIEKIDGNTVRELIDVDLFDVSVVTYPAYTDTAVALRSLAAASVGPTPTPVPAPALAVEAQRRRRRLALASAEC